LARVRLSEEGFFIVDDQGNERLFNDPGNNPRDQLSAAMTMRLVGLGYVRSLCSEHGLSLEGSVWARVTKWAPLQGDWTAYNNFKSDFTGRNWSLIGEGEAASVKVAVFEPPDFGQDPRLGLVVAVDHDWAQWVTFQAVVRASPADGFVPARLVLPRWPRAPVVVETDGERFVVTTPADTYRVDLPSPLEVVSEADYSAGIDAQIQVQGNRVSVSVGGTDLAQAGKEAAKAFLGLLLHLSSREKGGLAFLPKARFTNASSPPDGKYLYDGELDPVYNYRTVFGVNGDGWFVWDDWSDNLVVVGPGGDEWVGLVGVAGVQAEYQYGYEQAFGQWWVVGESGVRVRVLNGRSGEEFLVPWERLAVEGVCVVPV